MKQSAEYRGFELGPIRPPSEAGSLMLRLTRNCPWNKCKFCSLYKGEKFSIRPVDDVIKDIDTVCSYIDHVTELRASTGSFGIQEMIRFHNGQAEQEPMVLHSALNWIRSGMKSIFLQDANTLVMQPANLVAILNHIKKRFPQVERITSYARSHTIARISDDRLSQIATAGLNRIHVGMESAADKVLVLINKGVDKETHIKAGQKIKKAGIELSEYFMPGLGGKALSRENALETADALNQVNADFIRIRTLAIPETTELYRDVQNGLFEPMGDIQKAQELLLFLEHLEGVSSTLKSDHILNLFQEVEGRLPDDRDRLISPLKRFLNLSSQDQMLFMIGRRTGVMMALEEMDDTVKREQAYRFCQKNQITPHNVERFTDKIMTRFI